MAKVTTFFHSDRCKIWFSVLWGFVMCFHEKAVLYLYFRESYWQFRKICQMAAVTTKVTHFLKKNMHSPSYVLQWSVNEIFKRYIHEVKKYHIFCQKVKKHGKLKCPIEMNTIFCSFLGCPLIPHSNILLLPTYKAWILDPQLCRRDPISSLLCVSQSIADPKS